MDHQVGRINLIRWQGRRNRKVRTGVRPWTAIFIACAVLGAATMSAQAAGWLNWTGALGSVPAGLVLVAIAIQLVGTTRWLLTWLAG